MRSEISHSERRAKGRRRGNYINATICVEKNGESVLREKQGENERRKRAWVGWGGVGRGIWI